MDRKNDLFILKIIYSEICSVQKPEVFCHAKVYDLQNLRFCSLENKAIENQRFSVPAKLRFAAEGT